MRELTRVSDEIVQPAPEVVCVLASYVLLPHPPLPRRRITRSHCEGGYGPGANSLEAARVRARAGGGLSQVLKGPALRPLSSSPRGAKNTPWGDRSRVVNILVPRDQNVEGGKT